MGLLQAWQHRRAPANLNRPQKAEESRAASSLVRLLQSRVLYAAARDLLAPPYGGFTESFDTAILKGAKPLLIELGMCLSAEVVPSRPQ